MHLGNVLASLVSPSPWATRGLSNPRHRRRPLLLPSSRRRWVKPAWQTAAAGGLPLPTPLPPRAADLGGRRRCPAALAVWRDVAGLGERWRGAGCAAAGLGRRWRLRAGLTPGRWRGHGSIADLVLRARSRPPLLGRRVSVGGLLLAEIWQRRPGSSRSRQGWRRPVHERWRSSINSG